MAYIPHPARIAVPCFVRAYLIGVYGGRPSINYRDKHYAAIPIALADGQVPADYNFKECYIEIETTANLADMIAHTGPLFEMDRRLSYYFYKDFRAAANMYIFGSVQAGSRQLAAVRSFLDLFKISEDDYSEATLYKLWQESSLHKNYVSTAT